MNLIDKANKLLNRWVKEHATLPLPDNYPNNVLMSIADVIDEAKEEVGQLGLDPYDDFKEMTENVESDLIKCILDHEDFLESLTSTYLTGSRYNNDEEVRILAARIMSSAMNGIDSNAYFKEVGEDMIDLLYRWALADREPLKSYAVEILSYGEILCSRYHQNNVELVSMLLQQLKEIHAKAKAEYMAAHPSSSTSEFAPWNDDTQDGCETLSVPQTSNPLLRTELVGKRTFEEFQCQAVLHFLLSLGEYQEFLGLIMKNSILKLLLNYISITDINSPIIFGIIRYLSALLCHKKFASEFMNYDGLQLLLGLPFNQRALTGISTCFYALVFHSTVMERLCSYNRHLVAPMITICLQQLRGKHESGRSYVTLFLTCGFYYQTVIEEFDKQCGLPIFLELLKNSVEALKDPPSIEVEVFLLRQKVKQMCNALRQYLAGHTILYAEHLRRTKDHQGVGMSPQIYTNTKALELEDNIKTAYEYIQANADFDCIWRSIDDVQRQGGFETLIQAFFINETFRAKGFDASPCIITALTFLTILPRYQLKLTDQFTSPDGESHTVIKLILSAAESYGNIEIQRAALSLIVVVVCGPYRANANNMSLNLTPAQHPRRTSTDDVMHKMWSTIRTNNGIKVLMSLLLTKTPLVHADELRMAACKALNGLCRSRGVRQIASKLHLMSSGQLLSLMREPILPENVETHSKFCTYTRSLLEVLFGVSTDKSTSEPSLINKMTKVDIVSKTPIEFNRDEIYHLLHSTLLEHGLKSAANALVEEVKQKLDKDIALYPKSSGPQVPSTSHLMSPLTPCKKLIIRNSRSRVSSSNDLDNVSTVTPSSSCKAFSAKVPQKSFAVKSHLEALEARTTAQAYQPPSLNDLVHNFMRDQHMRCEHPMSIVPKFSLFQDHRCPDPHPELYEAPVNIVSRHHRKSYGVPYGGLNGRFRDYKLIFSKFKPYYTFRVDSRTSEEWVDVNFTSCITFSDYIVVGCNNGQIRVYKMMDHPPYYCAQTTDSSECEPITSLALSQSAKMMVSSSTGEAELDLQPNNSCTLWSIRKPGECDGNNSKDILEQRHVIEGVDHATFSHLTDDRLLCTMSEHKCCLVDCYTGKTVSVLTNPPGWNGYHKNHAVFNFTDDLVLNDGLLWDYRSSSPIYKFDKFNNFVSGVFTPAGIEIIINTEIWDMRTFKLLNTINSLDNCLLKYNHSQDIMYGLSHVKQEIHDHEISPSYKHVMGPFESTFKTFAANNGYPSLGTYDTGRQIIDLNFCRRDELVVTVESTNEEFTTLWTGGSVVKLYKVGRSKASREEDDDGEEDDDEDSGDNSELDEDGSSITSNNSQHTSPNLNTSSPAFTDYSSSQDDISLTDEELNDELSGTSEGSPDEEEVEEENEDDEAAQSLNFSLMSDSDEDGTQGTIVTPRQTSPSGRSVH